MSLLVDLSKDYAIKAFEAQIASLKRAANSGKNVNPLVRELMQKDINIYQHAINTIAEAPTKQTR